MQFRSPLVFLSVKIFEHDADKLDLSQIFLDFSFQHHSPKITLHRHYSICFMVDIVNTINNFAWPVNVLET